MAGKKEEVEPVVEATEEEVKPEVQTKTLSQEELDTLIQEAKTQGKAEAEETYKGIQRVLAKKDEEIIALKQLSQDKGRGVSMAPYKIMLEEMEARQDFGEPNPRIAQLKSLITEEEQKDATSKQAREIEQYTQTWKEKLEGKITQVGLSPDDEQFDDVWESFDLTYKVDGKFERAEKKLDRILKGVKPMEKTDNDFEERLKAEKLTWMKEHGLLEKETADPSAAALSDRKIQDDFTENPNDPKVRERYLQWRREKAL